VSSPGRRCGRRPRRASRRGARVTRQIPGRPVSLPWASAMFAAAASCRATTSRIGRVADRVEDAEVALSWDAEGGVRPWTSSWSTRMRAPLRVTGRRVARRRPSPLGLRLLLVVGVDVADRPLALPLRGRGGREKRGALVSDAVASTGSSPLSNQASPGRIRASHPPSRCAALPCSRSADPGPGCVCL